jgi:hypothetical protein
MKKFLFLITLFSFIGGAQAQELNCDISVITPQIQGTQKRVYESLERAMEEFMNGRKWTEDNFATEEKIEVSIQLTVNDQISLSEFKGQMQIQSSRPVYGSDYKTPLFFVNDQDIHISYQENTAVRWSRGQFTDNLSSILAYYAYMILGMDYDSFSEEGGTNHYEEAQAIVSNAQNGGRQGWRASDGTKNRYWLVENILSRTFEPLRECVYQYHRHGLDKMYAKTDEARATILESIQGLRQIHQIKPISYNIQMYFYVKSDELVKMFGPAPQEERQQAYRTLKLINPGNISKYEDLAG